jgi:hypothetical protein
VLAVLLATKQSCSQVTTRQFTLRSCGQFSNDLVKILTEEKRMKSNSSFNNNRTQIKVLEILFEKKIK